jgi:hypothetical protein
MPEDASQSSPALVVKDRQKLDRFFTGVHFGHNEKV